MKRIFAFMWCVVLAASPMAVAQKGGATMPNRDEFRNIPSGHWAGSSANTLARVGMLQGGLKGRFNGDAPLKRADFAIVLRRLSPWATVGSSAIAIPEWGQEQKSYFTRYEFAVALSRCSHFLSPGRPPFTDSEAPNGFGEFRDIPSSHWARSAAYHVAGLGVMEGHLQGRFDGNVLVTRYEFAVALLRYGIFRRHDLRKVESGAAFSGSR